MSYDFSGLPEGEAGSVRSEINVTPLVDVVLVLLIIFMVVTPLLQMGYDVTVPPKAEAQTAPPPPSQGLVVVSMTADKAIYINKEAVPIDQLALRLTEVLKNRANPTVFFSAADPVIYGDAVRVLDIMRNAGAKNVGIIEDFIDPSATAGQTS